MTAASTAERQASPSLQEWFSIKETAELTGLSTKAVRRALKSGALPYSDMNMGARKRPTYRMHRSDIDAWMRSCRPNVGPSTEEHQQLMREFYPDLAT